MQLLIAAAACSAFISSHRIKPGLTQAEWMEILYPIQHTALKVCAGGAIMYLAFYLFALFKEDKK